MKVYVVEPFGRGGLLQLSHLLSEGLSANGVDATLVTGMDYELEDRPRNFDVVKLWSLWQFGSNTAKNAKSKTWATKVQTLWDGVSKILIWQREWIKFTRFVLANKPDIIMLGTIFRYPLGWLYLNIIRLSGVKISQICHEYELREKNKNQVIVLYKKLNDRLYKHFDAIFFLSDYLRQGFLNSFDEVDRNKTHILPMGNAQGLLDDNDLKLETIRARYAIEDDSSVIVLFGRLATDKGIPDLIDAFAILKHEFEMNNVQLVISGPAQENTTKWSDQIKKLGVEQDAVIDAQYVPMAEMGALVKMAAVVVFPYRNASQSYSLQIAYICRRPVVATNVGALPEDVIDNKSGYIVEPHAPRQLAEAIAKLLNDPAKAKEMGEYAYQLSVTKHSWKNIGKEVAAVFRQIL